MLKNKEKTAVNREEIAGVTAGVTAGNFREF